VHSMNENMSHFSAQIAITEQPMYIFVGIARDTAEAANEGVLQIICSAASRKLKLDMPGS